MRRLMVGVLFALALVAAILWWRRAPDTDSAPDAPVPKIAPAPEPTPGLVARGRRDALRDRIVRRLDQRERAAAARPAPAASTSKPSSMPSPVPPRPPGNLRDHLGGREALLKELNGDFMPLADECIEQAQERNPALTGMLAIDVEVIADEDIGAVVEAAGPSERNEVPDPQLLECIRESAYSLSLPPPPEGSGRDRFMITLPIAPPDAGAAVP